MKRKAFTVSGLNRYLAQLIQADPLLSFCIVEGEISGYKEAASGHVYFQLKDQDARVDCVLFAHRKATLDEVFGDGDHVRLTGRAGLYERGGRYQINADHMERVGLGRLYEAFLAEKKRYENLGYFNTERKRALPPYPERIGIVSSAAGAALQDVLSVLRRRNPALDVVLFPSAVQGATAAAELAAGLEYFDGRSDIDAVLLTRGGGSLEDLWAFNEAPVVEAIYRSAHPVISAVGHETDHTLADFVADFRAPTPSAAAESVSPTADEMLGALYLVVDRLRSVATGLLDREDHRLDADRIDRMARRAERVLFDAEQKVAGHIGSLEDLASRTLKEKEGAFETAGALLDARSPLARLRGGHGYVENDRGPIAQIGDVTAGESIRVRLADGSFRATVDYVEGETHGKKHL